MKIMTGIISRDTGEIFINGEKTEINNIHHAEEMGIAIVPQELSFVSYFTVAENIFMGEEPTKKGVKLVDWKGLFTACDKKLDELRIDLPRKPRLPT